MAALAILVAGSVYAVTQISRDVNSSLVIGSVQTEGETILLYSQIDPPTDLSELDFGTAEVDAFGFFKTAPKVKFWVENGGAVPFTLTALVKDVRINGEQAPDSLVLRLARVLGFIETPILIPIPQEGLLIQPGEVFALAAIPQLVKLPGELNLDSGDTLTFVATFVAAATIAEPEPAGPPRIDFFGPRAQPDPFLVHFTDLPDLDPSPLGTRNTQGIKALNRTGPQEPFTSSCLPGGTGSIAYLMLGSPKFRTAPYAMTSTTHVGFRSLAPFDPDQLSYDFGSGNMLTNNIIDRHDLGVAGNVPMSLNDPLFDVLDNVVYFIEEGTDRQMEKRTYPGGIWSLIDNAGTPDDGADDNVIATGTIEYITLFLDYTPPPAVSQSTGHGLVRVDPGSDFFDDLTQNFGTSSLMLSIESFQGPALNGIPVFNDEPLTGSPPDQHWECEDPTGYAVFESSVSVTPGERVARDFIVGAPNWVPEGQEDAGSAYVYSGTDGRLIHQVNGENFGDLFGWSVSMLGDVDGDGVLDFIVGAPFADPDELREDGGSAYVYSGANRALIHQVDGHQGGDNFGWSVSGAGDIDGDGTPDFLVGAYHTQRGGLGLAGTVYFYSGAETFNAQFGYSVSGAGDVNGDGRADIVAGAPFTHHGAINNAGRAYVYSAIDRVLIHREGGQTVFERFGVSVSTVGDVDGDAVPDFMVGADLADPAGLLDAGSAFVYSGADGSEIHQRHGETASDNFGISVSKAGDVNEDGIPDFIVGAYRAGPGGVDVTGAGSAYVYSGADGNLLHKVDGEGLEDSFGFSVSLAGDVNYDGKGDFIVGARFADPNGNENAGAVYVFSGVDGSLLYRLDGLAPGDNFGHSVD